jgi:transposase-like protein
MNTDDGRKLRGLAIVAQAGTIERISPSKYRVLSQSGKGWYQVTWKSGGGEWKCNCPDAETRGVTCKHIFAVSYSLTLRDRVSSQSSFEAPNNSGDTEAIICPECGSPEHKPSGFRKNKPGKVQRWECEACHHRFVDNEGFVKMKHDGEIVAVAITLYFKGQSYRSVVDTIEQIYGIVVDHSTVIRWMQKYVQLAKAFVDGLDPETSGVYHVDEMIVHVRKTEPIKVGVEGKEGNYSWLWNLMDHDTRFLLASMISKRRSIEDARAVFKQAKKLMRKKPLAMVHDGLQAYPEAGVKEFYTNKGPKMEDIRSVGQRDRGLNQRVERINNTIRDREKTMRGMDHDESAQVTADGMRINYNFIRPNMALENKTPAEAAGLKLGLKGIRWKALIKKATKASAS